MKRIGIFILGLLFAVLSGTHGQTTASLPPFTHADTLRGSIGPGRSWWDVLHYTIEVKPDFEKKYIVGSNEIEFKVLSAGQKMQIDLQEPLNIADILWKGKSLPFHREGNAFFVDFPNSLNPGNQEIILIHYQGNPRVAVNPPWDGGWIFKQDKLGRPWMSVACQGLGASVWYPCKDHQSDEPDQGAILRVTVPDTLVAVGNGRLKAKKSNGDGTTTFEWAVVNPINNYNIVPYIGKYVGWTEEYPGEKGNLDCSFWVLDYNLSKAQAQFKQVDSMLHCFEYWMGPYPFYEDGYKLVEAPHLGMEHQSAVGYGNRFANGYLGRDLSGSGWGLKWDFIIVHESGHEWFGNNITSNDLADMWIHEGFTNYSETLFTTCAFGVEAGDDYCIGTRKNIRNDRPIIASYGVNAEGSGDMYYKGGNMLHMIRNIINDDGKFRQIWRGLNKDFYHQTVTTKQIEDYISQHAGIDFSKVFDQYLRTTQIPVLEFRTTQEGVSFRWTNCVTGFNMPLKVNLGKAMWINPSTEWQTQKIPGYDGNTFIVDRNFYIHVKKSE
jgi:aminopeptidase N